LGVPAFFSVIVSLSRNPTRPTGELGTLIIAAFDCHSDGQTIWRKNSSGCVNLMLRVSRVVGLAVLKFYLVAGGRCDIRCIAVRSAISEISHCVHRMLATGGWIKTSNHVLRRLARFSRASAAITILAGMRWDWFEAVELLPHLPSVVDIHLHPAASVLPWQPIVPIVTNATARPSFLRESSLCKRRANRTEPRNCRASTTRGSIPRFDSTETIRTIEQKLPRYPPHSAADYTRGRTGPPGQLSAATGVTCDVFIGWE